MQFRIGNEYTRTQIRNIVGDPGSNGKWIRGYLEHNNEFFVFCNIDGESYTGVDHNNHWISNDELSWNAVKLSKQDNPSLIKMLSGKYNVHIFTRNSNDSKKNLKGSPFTYRGLGNAKTIEGEKPVHVVWNVSCSKNISSQINLLLDEDAEFVMGLEESLNRFIPSISSIEDTPERYFFTSNKNSSKKNIINRDYKVATRAIINANFKCEIDIEHKSFISKRYNKQYVEAHHIIPVSVQSKYKYSLDKEANIIGLCPNCHRTIHHGIKLEREFILNDIYNKRINRLKNIGLDITLTELFEMYC